MRVDELAPGLWRWTATHPDWTPEQGGGEGWEAEVGCVFCETPDGIVLIDPLVPAEPEEGRRFWRALDKDVERSGAPPSVLLTVYWHARSSSAVAERYSGTRVFAPDGKREESERRAPVTDWFSDGRELPGDIVAFATPLEAEVVFWLPSHAAVVPGDLLLGDRAGGVRVLPDGWLGDAVTREAVMEALRPLLELPIERVLVSHGEPVLSGGRNALAQALVA